MALVKNYWRADKEYDYKPGRPPERIRLDARWKEELAKLDEWFAFLDELRMALPEFRVGDATAPPDGAFRCMVFTDPDKPTGFDVVGCKSVVAPVYTVYGVCFDQVNRRRRNVRLFFESLPEELLRPAEVIARKLEATFRVEALPREIADTPIPLIVDSVEPPHTTLFHALFTSRPDSLP
jgi:hypothetical protein